MGQGIQFENELDFGGGTKPAGVFIRQQDGDRKYNLPCLIIMTLVAFNWNAREARLRQALERLQHFAGQMDLK